MKIDKCDYCRKPMSRLDLSIPERYYDVVTEDFGKAHEVADGSGNRWYSKNQLVCEITVKPWVGDCGAERKAQDYRVCSVCAISFAIRRLAVRLADEIGTKNNLPKDTE